MSKCNPHPDAPHGFDRNASHNAGEYVCECGGWQCQGHAKQQERDETDLLTRLRAGWTPRATPLEFAEAADEIESLRERIKGFIDHNNHLSVQMADISIANMRANNFINDLGTVLRDSETPRDEAMEMIRNWYSEGGE